MNKKSGIAKKSPVKASPRRPDDQHANARRLTGQLGTAFAFPLFVDVHPSITALQLYALSYIAAYGASKERDTPESILRIIMRNDVDRRDLTLAAVVGAFEQLKKRRLVTRKRFKATLTRPFFEVYSLSEKGDRLLKTIASNLQNDLRDFKKATLLELTAYAKSRRV